MINDIFLCDRGETKYKLSSLDTFLEFISALIGYFIYLFLYEGGPNARSLASLAYLLAFNTTGGRNVIPFMTRPHEIDGLRIQRKRGAVLLSWILSLVRYIQPLAH
jgi:hypothetical protein